MQGKASKLSSNVTGEPTSATHQPSQSTRGPTRATRAPTSKTVGPTSATLHSNMRSATPTSTTLAPSTATRHSGEVPKVAVQMESAYSLTPIGETSAPTVQTLLHLKTSNASSESSSHARVGSIFETFAVPRPLQKPIASKSARTKAPSYIDRDLSQSRGGLMFNISASPSKTVVARVGEFLAFDSAGFSTPLQNYNDSDTLQYAMVTSSRHNSFSIDTESGLIYGVPTLSDLNSQPVKLIALRTTKSDITRNGLYSLDPISIDLIVTAKSSNALLRTDINHTVPLPPVSAFIDKPFLHHTSVNFKDFTNAASTVDAVPYYHFRGISPRSGLKSISNGVIFGVPNSYDRVNSPMLIHVTAHAAAASLTRLLKVQLLEYASSSGPTQSPTPNTLLKTRTRDSLASAWGNVSHIEASTIPDFNVQYGSNIYLELGSYFTLPAIRLSY